jgi:class 3 adenylate cyclase/HEAT repeat protein
MSGLGPTPAPAAPAPSPPSDAEAPRLPLEPLITTHRIFEALDSQKKNLEILHRDLFDSRPAVVLSALEAAGKLADTRSFPYVARLLAGAQEEVQAACVRALATIGHPDVPKLLRNLARTVRGEKLRREILAALSLVAPGDKDVAATIRQAVRAPMGSAGSRAHAAGLLLKMGGELALEELLPDAREEVLDRVIAAAAENPALLPRTVAHCAPLYQRLAARNRVVLVGLAVARPLPQSEAILHEALGDSNAEVRRAAYAVLGTEPHQVPWFSEIVLKMAAAVELNPALEDEAQAAIGRMAGAPDARAAVQPAVRAAVMSKIAELHGQLTAAGRKVSSDSHELGWLIMRSKEYLEFYGDEELKAALLRWLKGASQETPESLMKMLKGTAVRVEVRHFDGYSALADLIKNPKRNGIALVARELTLAKTGKNRVMWQLGRVLRLASVFLGPGSGGEGQQLKSIYTWARQEKLFRLAEAALSALAKADIPAAEAACKECLALPLASKVLAISSLHLLRELHLELLEPSATRLLASQDDPYVTMNALEAISAGPPSASGELARALLSRLSLDTSREVRDALVAFLGQKVSVDIMESLKESMLSTDEARRAAALSILDRRISNGLVANRDAAVEFLYRILRGVHEPSRRSAALMLWKMGDDYAPEVLRDFLATAADENVIEILRGLQGSLREPMLSGLAPLFQRPGQAVQTALRDLVLQLEDASLRQRAVEMAREARGGSGGEEEEEELFDEGTPAAEVRTERSAFQFERENMQELVMFFSDIQGYSKKAQVLSPMQLAALLQEYEKILLAHVEAHRGDLVKRMGDGHLFVFQEPLPAVLAAIRLQKSLRRFNRYRDETNRVVIRIGIHSGRVVRKGKGDVLGNAVNIASRLESSARPGSILISDQVHDKVKDSVHAREIGHITVKNISEPVRVFEPFEIVLDLPAELDPLKQSHETPSSAPAASGPVSLDAGVYAEILRCVSALVGVCRDAPAGQVPVSVITDRVLARWERLRPKLPRVLAVRKEGTP